MLLTNAGNHNIPILQQEMTHCGAPFPVILFDADMATSCHTVCHHLTAALIRAAANKSQTTPDPEPGAEKPSEVHRQAFGSGHPHPDGESGKAAEAGKPHRLYSGQRGRRSGTAG